MTRLYRLMLATAAVFGVPSAALADGPGSGEVTGVSVQASPGRADIVINVRGAVEVRDFMLQTPDRLVLDVMGARLKGKSINAVRWRQAGRRAQRPLLAVRPRRGADRPRARSGEGLSRRARHRRHPGLLRHRPVVPGLVVERPGPASGQSPRLSAQPEVQLPAARLTRVTSEEPRITVVWDRANVADVVAGFAAFSGRTIILGKGHHG